LYSASQEIHASRFYPEVGGLISYGTSVTNSQREADAYVGRILKGAKPADLPVMQSSRFEPVFNVHTAKLLGLTMPVQQHGFFNNVVECDPLLEGST
jgi:putative ABC transport system substrate-binding protein